MKRFLITGFTVATVVFSAVAGRLSDQEISEFGGCYFAPLTSTGLWRMRTQDGEIREFETDARKKNVLRGVDGWWAAVGKEKAISVHAPETGDYPPLVYNFKNGRLASLDVEGKHCRFGYPDPLVYDDGVIFPLWPDAKEVTREEFSATTSMWKPGRRLRLWFPGPNQAGAFLASVFLIFLGLSFSSGLRLPWRVILWGLSAVAFSGLVLTASRGALLGTVVALAAMAICDRRLHALFTWRRALSVLSVCVLLALCAVFVMYSSVRDRKSDRKSDNTRIELYKAAPVMMCDAPYGWGGFNAVGKAYSDWYAPDSDSRFRLNLVNDHLTMLAGNGWFGGFLYLWMWFAGLALCAVFAWRGGSSVPLGVWIALGIASFLNVVLFAPMVIWVPLGTLAFFAFDRRWLRARCLAVSASFGALAAAICLGGILLVSRFVTLDEPCVTKDGDRILVNGDSPSIWIVDDGESIGGVLAPRDIRAFYRRYPDAPAIGYVRNFSDLPREGVRRLVLVGDAAQWFMVPYTRKPGSVSVPEEILFLSPQFPYSDIPDDLLEKSSVTMAIGEFAARYWEEFTTPPEWVSIVSGAEVYIPRWMALCVRAGLKEKAK